MKRIRKRPEPVAFREWKSVEAEIGVLHWDAMPPETKIALKQSLLEEQGYICCYCEQRVSERDSHMEHFRPRSKPEYEHLQLDYSNLHASCQQRLRKGEPRHCGHLKADWFEEGQVVGPLDANCEQRFLFTGNGEVSPRDDGDAAALTTIERLGLDIPKIRALRSAAIDALCAESPEDVLRLLASSVEGNVLPFFTAVSQVLSGGSTSSDRPV